MLGLAALNSVIKINCKINKKKTITENAVISKGRFAILAITINIVIPRLGTIIAASM
jgi:hypothetical protein